MAELLLLEGDDLAELMLQVREQLGARATIVRAERLRTGGIGGFFSRERYELTVEVADGPAPAAPTFADPLEALLDAADRAESGEREEADDTAPAVSTAGARFAAVLQHVQALAGAQDVPVTPAPRPVPTPARGAPAGTAWGRVAAGLFAAGVPGELLDRAASFADVLAKVPVAPPAPRGPGQVLVLVGAREALISVATVLRHQWRLPGEAVVDATGSGLTSSAAMVRWRFRIGGADHPWLLLVDGTDDGVGRGHTAGLVAAAQPDQLWAVVDARTKADDAARWLGDIGTARRPDARAVCGLLDTGAPGTLLGLGLPVAWADGIPPSRALWAAVLGQRVEDALRR